MSIRDKIRDADDIEKDLVTVPEWGVDVEVRSLTGTARADFLASYASGDGEVNWHNLYPEVLIAHCFDPETGERLFEESDRTWIMSKSGAAIDRVATAAMNISGLGAKAVDDLGKSSSGSETSEG